MDMEQQPELDSSCDTGSFERNDAILPNFSPRNQSPVNIEDPFRKAPVKESPGMTSQLSIQSRASSSLYSPRSCSFDSAMSDTEIGLARTLSLNEAEFKKNLRSLGKNFNQKSQN